ncbi:Rrp15p-domain-containing protein [Geranomyces variabilis]|nr:Rrp15p-domain-containing protein [Geranomyces variabilis]KAJ3138380.1 hypothetical protein HDU90_001343 [Geranomyces variabilis]
MPPKRQRPKQAPASKNGSGAEARGKRRRTVVQHQQDNYVSPTEDSDNDTQHNVLPTSKPQRGQQQPRGNTELLSFDDAAAQAGSSEEEEEDVVLGEEDEDDDEEEGDEFDMDAMDDDDVGEEEEEEGDESEEEDAGDAAAVNDNDPRKTKESKLASAIGKILAGDLGAKDATRPILAKQKHLEQAINNEKLEDKARRVITAEKKKKIEVGHVVPDHTTTDYEKKLRKVATRGVVKLFNAIRVAQRTAEEVKSDGVLKNRDAAPVISKNTFLDMIKPKTASDDANAAAITNTTAKPVAGAAAAGAKNKPAASAAAGSGPSWAKEDYMMKAPKHWDEEDDEEEADVV